MWRGVERRFNIYAPQMAVRPHVAWYIRWGLAMPFVFAAAGAAWWAYDSGLEFAGFRRNEAEQEISKLKDRVAKQADEIILLTNQVAQYERKIQIEQASNEVMAEQLQNLADENTKLQEDLVFFQNLTASGGKDGELGVHRLILDRDKIPGEYRLRMLLVQSGQRARIFNGYYQLVATVTESGQNSTHIFPREGSGNDQFKLSFRYYQRIEQSLQLPEDAALESVQVRIFEQGSAEPKVRQSVSLSTTQGVIDVQQETQ